MKSPRRIAVNTIFVAVLVHASSYQISATEPIRVLEPVKLAGDEISAHRVPLGIPNDYKPSLAKMPDGELVLVAFYPETRPDGSYHEWTVLWRSSV